MVKQTLFKGTIGLGVGTTAVEFCSGGRELCVTLNATMWEFITKGQVGGRGRVSIWKSTKRKHQWKKGFWLN